MKRFLKTCVRLLTFSWIPIILICICLFYHLSFAKRNETKPDAYSYADDVLTEAYQKQDAQGNIFDFNQFKNPWGLEDAEPIVAFSSQGDSTTYLGKKAFQLTVLDVGQALCVILESNGEYLMFDGGDYDTSSFVVSYCKQHDYSRFSYIVASHYDSDHVAGLIGVLESLDVKQVIMPDYVSDTATYQKFLDRAFKKEVIYPYVGETFQVGDVTLTTICCGEGDYSDENGYSIGFLGEYQGFRFLIDGDATKETELDMLESGLDLSADLLIVPHHGSSYSNSEAWLWQVHPSIAVISCGERNAYYHPHESVLKRLQACGVTELYRTDLNGTITVFSDGEHIVIESERTADIQSLWAAGEGAKTE